MTDPRRPAPDAAVADPVRLIVVDDEPMVRQGLAMILGSDPEVVGAAGTGWRLWAWSAPPAPRRCTGRADAGQ